MARTKQTARKSSGKFVAKRSSSLNLDGHLAKRSKQRTRLQDAMEVILSKSKEESFFSGQAHDLPVAPGLAIEGYGPIALPINAAVADSLKPYGRKATFHNLACKPWEFDASIITIANPDWSFQLQKLVDKMSCWGQARPILHKGFLCEKGRKPNYFSFHKESEKEKNVFATLVIQVPSICTGGKLVVELGDRKKDKFDFGQQTKKAAYSMHYAAHSAEFERSLEPVTSGYQFLLTYSLCWKTGFETMPSVDSSLAANSFCKALIEYLNAPENFSWGILLDHTFETTKKSGMGLSCTLFDDNTLYNIVRCFNQNLDSESKLRILMVQLTRTVKSYFDNFERGVEVEWLEYERSDDIDRWFDENGDQVKHGDSPDINISDIFRMDGENVYGGAVDWGDLASSVETYSDGPHKEEKYHRYAMVIHPARNEV